MLEVILEKIINETPGTKTFVLKTSEPIIYEAGQFITFIFQGKENEIRRSYSFSSAPSVDSMPAITIKRNENGAFSRWWIEEAIEGDRLLTQGVSGKFIVSNISDECILFFAAAGSGITPVFSMIKWVLKNHINTKLHLVYSNRNKATTIFYDELKKLEAAYADRLSIDWFFSENADLFQARLSTYNLQRILIQKAGSIPAYVYMFTCGPYDYMKMVEVTWLSMGFRKQNFKRELYDLNLYSPPSKQYYDKKDRKINFQSGETIIPVLVKWNETILDAALRNGIKIPYNCRGGICSTCICTKLSGKVWMHYNEVLTTEDENKGLILTCTAHPVTNDVIISIPPGSL